MLVLSAVFVCACIAQTAQSNHDETEWNRIRTTKSEAELLAFMQKYPDSKFANFASRRIDELEWEKVDKTNPAAVKDFLRRFPDLQVEIPAAMQARLESQSHSDEQQPGGRSAAAGQAEGIEKTLHDLTLAYGSRNMEAVRSLWPGLPNDAAKKTQQLFKDASSLNLKLEPTSPAIIEGDVAIIVCRQTLDTAQDDRAKIDTSLVSVKMKRVGQQWLIQSLQ
jgi:hypothetical protein